MELTSFCVGLSGLSNKPLMNTSLKALRRYPSSLKVWNCDGIFSLGSGENNVIFLMSDF